MNRNTFFLSFLTFYLEGFFECEKEVIYYFSKEKCVFLFWNSRRTIFNFFLDIVKSDAMLFLPV